MTNDLERQNELASNGTLTMNWDGLPWTEKRLLALYRRYNQRYWRGDLPPYNIKIKGYRHYDGRANHRSQTITIDVANHQDDDDVRLTLLHEMVHVAALESPAHSLAFWREVDRILGMGAPPEMVLPIPRQLRTILRTKAGGFTLFSCKMAVRKMGAKRERFQRWEKDDALEQEHWDTVTKFQDVAETLTWTQALVLLGPETGLVDQQGKPRSRRDAEALAVIKKSFQQERRWHLVMRPGADMQRHNALAADLVRKM